MGEIIGISVLGLLKKASLFTIFILAAYFIVGNMESLADGAHNNTQPYFSGAEFYAEPVADQWIIIHDDEEEKSEEKPDEDDYVVDSTPWHLPIPIAEITVNGMKTEVGDWERSTDITQKESVQVALLASWCPYSIKFLEKLKRDPGLAREYDFLVFQEDDVTSAINTLVNAEKISVGKGMALQDKYESEEVILFRPDVIGKFNFPIYLVEDGHFDKQSTSYPSTIYCDSKLCKKIATKQ